MKIAGINKYVSSIDVKLRTNQLISKKYPDRAQYGGTLTGYYYRNQLVLVTDSSTVSSDYHILIYYMDSDTLVCVKELWKRINESKLTEDFGKNDSIDIFSTNMKNLPLEINQRNKFYICNNKIIHYIMRSFGKNVMAPDQELNEKYQILVTHFNSHVTELRDLINSQKLDH
ncbi:MAG: hypothetical protein JNJ85_07895 [Candidatus Kapabacteria bacterium]|nr:hypothetical protein [Candidatus Kapabacteria bacterium]